MNAEQVVSRLIREGLAEEVEARGGFVIAARAGDTEIAAAGAFDSPAGARRRMPAAWKRRVGNTPLTLLLLADAPGDSDGPQGPGRLLAVGPTQADQGPYSVPARPLRAAVEEFVERAEGVERLRWLARELAHLGLSGIPGALVRGLLTEHTLERLRKQEWWPEAERATAALRPGDDWRKIFGEFGYRIETRADGYHLHAGERPAAGLIAFSDSTAFDRFDDHGRPPEGRLARLCGAANLRYGLMAAGGRLRLFRFDAPDGSGASDWLELDAAALDDRNRPLLALVAADSLAGGGFEQVFRDSRRFGVELWKRLDRRIRDEALPALAREIEVWAQDTDRDLSDRKAREDLEQASLTLVFRLLFLLYAESAGFLPVHDADYRRASLTQLVREARRKRELLSPKSRALWDGFVRLVRAMRNGNPAWQVPAYNGALFAEKSFLGAETLERLTLRDPGFGDILTSLGWDEENGCGVDASTIEIGHLGHIYESLLTRRLTLATREVVYDPKKDRYRPPGPGETKDREVVAAGALLWQTHLGGRKAGGVYYTPSVLVRHLVERAVAPAFEKHLERVRKTAVTDPERAAGQLLDFSVLDPACGSAHFLVEVLNRLADLTARFLGTQPLPALAEQMEMLRVAAGTGAGVRDMALLRRLLLKHCIYGVDVSPMGVEIATLSLWLGGFVPGLSLSYLGRNVVLGNSLLGVADPETVVKQNTFEAAELRKALKSAGRAAAELADNPDRTPEEYEANYAFQRAAEAYTEGMRRLFDLWAVEPEAAGSRDFIVGRGKKILDGAADADCERRIAIAADYAERRRVLHWPLEFPQVFLREPSGFDAIVGNPPWEEITVEELTVYVMASPGLNSLPQDERELRVAELDERDPAIRKRLVAERERAQAERQALALGEYEGSSGDPDLYKYFCQRYRRLLREDGAFGVVLPRSAFSAKGSEQFREWLYQGATVRRVDTLLNKARWAFDMEPRYSVALVAAENSAPSEGHAVEVAGTADSEAAWQEQAAGSGVRLAATAFGPGYQTPLARSQEEADLLERVRRGSRFPYGSGDRWWCFPVAELHETNDAHFWRGRVSGRPLWKGESFDRYEPTGRGARRCPSSQALLKKIRKPFPGSGSLLRRKSKQARRFAVRDELERARIAFRDVTNRTNSRTVIACLIPPRVLLTNKAPYLAFLKGKEREQAVCLGILNSAPFDWQARRFVEINLNFFVLEGLVVPDLDDDDFHAVAEAAARLSAVDERFADFARATGVECGPLEEDERRRLRAEIDARVAHAWELDENDLALMFSDFTEAAVPTGYRDAVRLRLRALNG